MSPHARSLLALACAALLHASSADMAERFRAEIPGWNEKWPCAPLDMGIKNDPHARKVYLKPFTVPHGELIIIPNVAKPDESLIGQHLHVCDKDGEAKKIWLKPVSPGKHSPVRVHCYGFPFFGCRHGVVVYPAQYVIKKIL